MTSAKGFVAVAIVSAFAIALLPRAADARQVGVPHLRGPRTAAQNLVLHGGRFSKATAKARARRKRRRIRKVAGNAGASVRIHFLVNTLNGFRAAALSSQDAAENWHVAEEKRLQESISQTSDDGVRLALEQSISSNEQSLIETQESLDDVIGAADALSGLLNAASSKGALCEEITCGLHASCTETMGGAKCVCNEGYVGTGDNCHAPPEYKPHHLLFEGSKDGAVEAVEINVCVFAANKFAVVYRDVAAANVGRLVLGTIGDAGRATVLPPEQFTQLHGKAYSPIVQGSEDKRILIAWRDQNRGGNGLARGGVLGASGIRGAEMALTWGEASVIASQQAHKMALVSLPNHRFALLHTAMQSGSASSFGNSALLEVGSSGSVATLGEFRFSDFAVCRLEVAKVSKTAFVIAARGVKTVDDMAPGESMNQEAIAVFGEAVGNDLVFDPNALNLEPQGTDIWARGISLIAPNTVAYAYQEGGTPEMKMAVVKIDPTTHGLEVMQSPVVIRDGFSPYVSMVNMPYTPTDPHTLVYYQMGNSSMVNLCSWDAEERKLARCEDFTWFADSVASVHGVKLPGGKAFMVFSTPSGVPYYTVFGLAKK